MVPPAVLAAAVLAAEEVPFLLVGSAAAILEALHSGQVLRSATALARVEQQIGLAPGYAYPVLVGLAQPWTMPIRLVNGQGNFGSRGNDPPASFRYTEARITRAGG